MAKHGRIGLLCIARLIAFGRSVKSTLLAATLLLLLTVPTARAAYWNVFNIEDERALSAQIVTYATLADMLGDVNRTGVFTPNPSGFGVNIVGSGSDAIRIVDVPEPSTLALLGLGLAGLAAMRRRNKQ